MSKFKNVAKKLTAVVMALVVFAGLSSTALAAFGPNRPTKAWSPTVEGFDHVVYNSFTGVGNGVGDERDFMRGVVVGRDSVWSDPVQNINQDSIVEAKIYIHNNADASLNTVPDGNGGFKGVAKDVNVRVALPTGEKKTQDATSYISASNANPGTVYDTLSMTGANNNAIGVEYVPGSAQLHKNNVATPLSDSLVTTGVNLGDQKGCFDYVQEVTFRMKIKTSNYKVTKSVRVDGGTKNDWKDDLAVKPGQIEEWKVEFDNIGSTQLHNVIILDQLPANVTVVPGSVKLIDGNFPNGMVYKDSEAVQNNGTQININIGNVNPGINSIIAFKTKVNDNKTTQCGTQKLVNTGYATPEGFGAVKDTASVTVTGNNKDCTPPPVTPTTPATPTPTTLVNTGPGDVAAIFAATVLGGYAAYNVYTKRRLSRQ